jgi:hypothetical protein
VPGGRRAEPRPTLSTITPATAVAAAITHIPERKLPVAVFSAPVTKPWPPPRRLPQAQALRSTPTMSSSTPTALGTAANIQKNPCSMPSNRFAVTATPASSSRRA